MRSEDDIPCSRRLTALVAVVLLCLIGVGRVNCLEVHLQGRGHVSGISRDQMVELFQMAGRRIEYLTGLDSSVQVRVLVHQDPHEYLRVGLPSWSTAAYRYGVIHLRNPLMYSRYRDLYKVLSHELFHALVDHHGLALPVWFEEGLAQVLSSGFTLPNPDTRYVDPATKTYYLASHQALNALVDRYGWEGIRHFFHLLKDHSFTVAYQSAFPLEESIPDISITPME